MNTNHTCASRQKLFSAKFVAKATIAAATALTAAGFLGAPAPAQAGPPLAPPCSQYGFTGGYSLREDAGPRFLGAQTFFSSTGPTTVGGRAVSVSDDNVTKWKGTVSGGIKGRNIDFTITWEGGPDVAPSHYTGTVGDDGTVHRGVSSWAGSPIGWDSINGGLGCIDAPPSGTAVSPVPKGPLIPFPAPDAPAPAARLGVAVNGPTTLPAGQSGTYTVNVSNSGDVGAPVELYLSYSGKLQQTGQVSPSGGFNCDVQNYPGGTSSVHCTVGQFGSKATAAIVVQGRGSTPGAGGLDVNINSSDPAAQFVEKSQKLNVTIT